MLLVCPTSELQRDGSDSKDRQSCAPKAQEAAASMGGYIEQILFALLGWWGIGKLF